MTEGRAVEVMRKFFAFGESLTGIAILAENTADNIVGFAGLFPSEPLGVTDFEIGFVLARSAWAGGLRPKSERRNLPSGSKNSTARVCSGSPIPEISPRSTRLKNLDCGI